MSEQEWLAERFEEHRTRLRALAYRMLGSTSEADDAVQEAWLRLSRTDAESIENFGGFLTTVTARVCLNLLRSRGTRREDALEDPHVPDPIVTDEHLDPEREAMLADSVGLALLVVFDTLSPAERLAFVLHDMFAVPFDEIAPILDRTPEATRQLASRARRRVQGSAPQPDVELDRQREVVEAFFLAARAGEFDKLVALLDPDVVMRADAGASRPKISAVVHGAEAVAGRALTFANPRATLRPVLVNGAAGVLVTVNGHRTGVIGFTVQGGHIVAIDALADPERLRNLDLGALEI
jgi:RNA polymerase sigma-70 factor (ECF subfamily)